MRFNYTLSGTIEVPAGSKLNDFSTGIVLPDGQVLKVWEAWELADAGEDNHRDVAFDELESMGIFYDGDPATFEEAEPDRGGPAAVQAAGDT